MKIKKYLINQDDNQKFIFDYQYADFVLRIFSVFWLMYVVYSYYEIFNRPHVLFEPIIRFQKIFVPIFPTPLLFLSVILVALFLLIITLFNQKIIFRILLFLVFLWLNTIKWNYNFFSHVGYVFILAHLFFSVLPPKSLSVFNDKKNLEFFSRSIRWVYAGILVTYSMAGFWKIVALAYKLLLQPNNINWVSSNAIELNAIVSARFWDESISKAMLNIYSLPYVWESLTVIIFFIQFIAVFGAFNKKLSYFILLGLLLFHVYNMIFINTSFYVASFVLLILLFPYHLIFNKKYNRISNL